MTFWSRLLASILALVILSPPQGAAAAQEAGRLTEQDVKAGMIYNFLRYTHWPEARGPLTVCVYGRDPFAGRLAPMEGRTVNQRAIEVLAVDAAAPLERCSLLFLNGDEREQWPRLRTVLEDQGVLTVSDYDGFARSGGIIEFTRVNNRVGVRINVAAANAAHLRLEDRLLRLASVVSAR